MIGITCMEQKGGLGFLLMSCICGLFFKSCCWNVGCLRSIGSCSYKTAPVLKF